MAATVITKKTDDGGRSVKLTEKNRDAVIAWLGDAFSVGLLSKNKVDSVRVKTPKGVRVVKFDDVIVKYGTRRNNGTVTFQVVKA